MSKIRVVFNSYYGEYMKDDIRPAIAKLVAQGWEEVVTDSQLETDKPFEEAVRELVACEFDYLIVESMERLVVRPYDFDAIEESWAY